MSPRSAVLLGSFALVVASLLGIAAPTSAASATASVAHTTHTTTATRPSCTPDSGADFAGKTVTPADLVGDLACANFRDATLDGLDLTQKHLAGSDFTGASLQGATFVQAELVGADFHGAKLQGAEFGQAELSGADFTNAQLDGADLGQATVSAAVFTGIRAVKASLTQTDLSGLSLRGADLRQANLVQATLKGTDFTGADLGGAQLDQADLTGADLTRANVTRASLDQATTARVSFDGLVGAFPLDAFTALLTLVLALIVFLPRLRPSRGRVAAIGGLVLVAAGTAAELMAANGWTPTADALPALPLLTPVIFIGLFAAAALSAARPGWLSTGAALVTIAGFFLLLSAGLAFLGDSVFGLLPFQAQCTTAACLGGAARGATGIVSGAVLMVAGVVLSRSKRLRSRPPADAEQSAPSYSSASA